MVHRGLALKFIGLAPGHRPGEHKQVKIFKTSYHVRLLDMHRSDPFGPDVVDRHTEDLQLTEGWYGNTYQDAFDMIS